MVPLWKPMLMIVPAGLALGMIGGNLAHPVMQQRPGDAAVQALFQTRADRYGLSSSYPEQPQGDLPYVGGYSYAPTWARNSLQGWSPPYDDREWAYSDLPLPKVAELDARQAALLADPEVEFGARPPMDNVDEAADAAQPAVDDTAQLPPEPRATDVTSAAPVESGPEPSSADGQPAIW